jgi:hypothetical protein
MGRMRMRECSADVGFPMTAHAARPRPWHNLSRLRAAALRFSAIPRLRGRGTDSAVQLVRCRGELNVTSHG